MIEILIYIFTLIVAFSISNKFTRILIIRFFGERIYLENKNGKRLYDRRKPKESMIDAETRLRKRSKESKFMEAS